MKCVHFVGLHCNSCIIMHGMENVNSLMSHLLRAFVTLHSITFIGDRLLEAVSIALGIQF